MKTLLPIILMATMLLTGGQARAITVNIYYTGKNGIETKIYHMGVKYGVAVKMY